MSSGVESDHVTDADKDAAATFRAAYELHARGLSEWQRDRKCPRGGHKRGKPKPPSWSEHRGNFASSSYKELQTMGLLLRAGWDFKNAWPHVLVHCLLTRTKAAAASRWGALKKDSYMTEHCGMGMDSAEKVVEAKRTARLLLQQYLGEGVPVLGEKPLSVLDREEGRGLKREWDGDGPGSDTEDAPF